MRLVILLTAALAASETGALAQQEPVSKVDVLLGAQAVLHVADMVTTGYVLTRGRPYGAYEANPVLRSVGSSPVAIAAVSGAIVAAETAVIQRIEPRHPRLAVTWSLALVGFKVWATINNINAAGRIQQQMWRR